MPNAHGTRRRKLTVPFRFPQDAFARKASRSQRSSIRQQSRSLNSTLARRSPRSGLLRDARLVQPRRRTRRGYSRPRGSSTAGSRCGAFPSGGDGCADPRSTAISRPTACSVTPKHENKIRARSPKKSSRRCPPHVREHCEVTIAGPGFINFALKPATLLDVARSVRLGRTPARRGRRRARRPDLGRRLFSRRTPRSRCTSAIFVPP